MWKKTLKENGNKIHIWPTERKLEMDIKEKQWKEWFEKFMSRRGCNTLGEFADYIMHLEDARADYEHLVNKIEELNHEIQNGLSSR